MIIYVFYVNHYCYIFLYYTIILCVNPVEFSDYSYCVLYVIGDVLRIIFCGFAGQQ